MLPKCSLVSGAQLDTWASKGIEGASILGFTIAWASREGIEGASTLGFTIALASMGGIDGHRPLFILCLWCRGAASRAADPRFSHGSRRRGGIEESIEGHRPQVFQSFGIEGGRRRLSRASRVL